MEYFAALTSGILIGAGIFFGLNALGREIRTGLVEAAKVNQGNDVPTPDVNK